MRRRFGRSHQSLPNSRGSLTKIARMENVDIEAKIIQIDGAAFAFTRLRFIRALVASGLVSVPTLIIVALISLIANDIAASKDTVNVIALVMTAVTVPPLIIVSAVGLSFAISLLSLVNHRLLAVASLYPIVVFPLVVFLLAGASILSGDFSSELNPVLSVVLFLALCLAFLFFLVISIALFVEMALYAFWTIFASKQEYLSVRGWRPRWWRVIANFQQQLGFPTFAAFFSRGRARLVGLFFAIAFLNSYFFSILTLPLWAPHKQAFDAFAAHKRIPHEHLRLSEWRQKWTPAGIATITPGCILALLSLLGVGRKISDRARRYATKLYQGVREWDTRPPILFLRSFNQDKIGLKVRTLDRMLTWPAGLGRARQLDEILLETGAPYGPIIAIGDPHDPIPPLGAARIFVRDAQAGWQEVVRALINASNVVVICPTGTEGVAWEICQLRDRFPRTIFLASIDMPRENTIAMFEDILRGARLESFASQLKRGRRPIAAFLDPVAGWTVLAARVLSVQTYTVAMNRAFQSMLGKAGAPLSSDAKKETAVRNRQITKSEACLGSGAPVKPKTNSSAGCFVLIGIGVVVLIAVFATFLRSQAEFLRKHSSTSQMSAVTPAPSATPAQYKLSDTIHVGYTVYKVVEARWKDRLTEPEYGEDGKPFATEIIAPRRTIS